MPVDQRILQLERSRRAGDPVRTLAACRALRADLPDDVALAVWADAIEAAALCDDDDTRKARPLAERAAIEARRHGIRAMVAVTARVLGEILLAQGDRQGARQRFAWAGDALGDPDAGAGDALRVADLDAARALLAHQSGASVEAEAHAADAVAAYDRAGESRAAAVVLLLGAEIRDLAGDPVGAGRILDAVERRLTARDEVLLGALDLARANHALAATPDRDGGARALAHAHRGLDRIVVGAGPGLPADRSKGRARPAQARGWLCVGRANQALDDVAGALVAYERAAGLFEAAGRPPDPARIASVDLLLRRRAFGQAREVLDGWLAATDPDADPARLAAIHTLMLPCAAEQRDFTAFDRHLRRLAAIGASPGPTTPVAARAARQAGELCGAIEDGGAGSRSRAVRAHAVARAAFASLSLPDEVAVEEASLAALGARAAPVPAGPFDLVRRIGLGATGEVWRGRHHDRRWPVAVKILALPHDDPRYRALIADEIRAVAALDHPNVVRVVGTGAIGPEAERMTRGAIRAGAPWFAMELADAGTLAEVCGALSWRLCRSVLLSLLDALAHAHARGVVHLDLKPANVLLRTLPDGRRSVLLTDFGLAGIARAAWSTEIAGTPNYMAPEQFTGDRRDFGPWTDLYALGCLAVDLVTGSPPFPGESLAEQRAGHLEAPVPRLRPQMACPPELRGWIERLLTKAPSGRFQRAADAAWQLAQLPTEVEAPDEAPEPFAIALSLASVRAVVPPEPKRAWGTAAPVAAVVPPDWRAGPGAAPVGLDVDLADAALDLFALRQPPLVGRNAERDQLWACLERASARGTPVVVGIEGPRGSGKTALARWLGERGHELGAATALDGGPGPDGLQGLRAMVARHLRLDGLDRDARFARVHRGVPELPRAVVEDLVALTGDEDQGTASTGERVGAVAAFVASIAAQRPVVIRIEPVGEPHPEELLLVRVLSGVPAPVVVLCEIIDLDADVDDEDLEPTADGDRPLNRPDVGWRLASAHHVRIGPMRDEDVGALLDARLPLRPSLRARIIEIAAGNPELAVQLVTDRIAADALVAADGAYELRPGARLALPAPVALRYAERIATVLPGLTNAERNVVCAAALLGPGAVLAQRWTALCEAADVDEELLFARLEGLVRPHARRGPRFEHPAVPLLLREAWADLAAAELAVAALEAVGAPPAVLGPLMLRAGRIRECVEPLIAGAQGALTAGDLDRASELLDRRAEVLGALGRRLTARDALLRAQIACAAGRSFADAAEAAEASAAADGDRASSARAWVLRAIAAHDAGDTAVGRERAERAAAVFASLDDRDGAAEAWCVAADVARTGGDLAAAERGYQAALAALGAAADGPSLGPAGLERASAARIGLARVALARGQVGEAHEALDRLSADLAALGTAISAGCLSDVACAQGDVARHANQVPEAETHYRSALARAPYHLVRRLRAIQLRRILLRLVAGRATEAGGALDALLVSDGRVGAGDHSPFAALCRLVELALAVRRDDRTWSLALGRARSLAARVHDPDAAWLLDVTGRRAHDAGRRDRAQIAWTLAMAVYRTLGRDADVSRIEESLTALDRRPPPATADGGG